METKQTVVEKYNKELEEIEELIELVKCGEISDCHLMSRIKSLAIDAYYDGKCDGMQKMHDILKN